MQADPPKIAEDTNLATEQAQAQKSLVDNLQNQAQLDTANIMARYGTRLALGGSGMAAPAPAPAPSSPIRF